MLHFCLFIENSSLVSISFEQFYLYYSFLLEKSCFSILIFFLSSLHFHSLFAGATIAEFNNVAIPGIDNLDLDLEHALDVLNGSSLVFLIISILLYRQA